MSKKIFATAKAVQVEIDGDKVYAQFSQSPEKKTDYVLVNLQILDGELEGRVLRWNGFFTKDSVDRTLEQLRLLGLRGDSVSAAIEGPLDNVVPVTIEEEEYEKDGKKKTGYRVAWINRSTGGGVKLDSRMSKDDMIKFDAKLRQRLQGISESSAGAPNGASSKPAEVDL